MKAAVLVVAVLLFVLSSAAWCQSVTFDASGLTIKSALDALLQGTGKTYVLGPGVDAGLAVPPNCFVDVPYEVALRKVLKSARLTFVLNEGSYAISPDASPAAQTSTSASPPPDAAPEAPKFVTAGMTRYEVTQLLGKPERKAALDGGAVFYYGDLIVIFDGDLVRSVQGPATNYLRFKVSSDTRIYMPPPSQAAYSPSPMAASLPGGLPGMQPALSRPATPSSSGNMTGRGISPAPANCRTPT